MTRSSPACLSIVLTKHIFVESKLSSALLSFYYNYTVISASK